MWMSTASARSRGFVRNGDARAAAASPRAMADRSAPVRPPTTATWSSTEPAVEGLHQANRRRWLAQWTLQVRRVLFPQLTESVRERAIGEHRSERHMQHAPRVVVERGALGDPVGCTTKKQPASSAPRTRTPLVRYLDIPVYALSVRARWPSRLSDSRQARTQRRLRSPVRAATMPWRLPHAKPLEPRWTTC
jgi:hypothetical protein